MGDVSYPRFAPIAEQLCWRLEWELSYSHAHGLPAWCYGDVECQCIEVALGREGAA